MEKEVRQQTQELLSQARAALARNDRASARHLAQQAVQNDPECGAAWVILAQLSRGSAQRMYQERANRFSTSGDKYKKGEPTQKTASPASFKLFSIITGSLVLLITLLAVVIWLSFPTRKTVSAVDHSAMRVQGELQKPSLTPTETPLPSPTHTPTNTLEPTATVTPQLAINDNPISDLFNPISEIPAIVGENERWIDVDLTHQRTYAFQGSTLIRTFIVSTGTQYHPTVTGEYRIYVKYRYTDMAGPGYYLPDVPYTMYFYKGYSLHGTYWHNNFGVPMSHGCVNLSIPDAEWLFYWASVGTLVNVHY